MPTEKQADIFIKALTELLALERAYHMARLRRQHKANAEHYMQVLGADPFQRAQPAETSYRSRRLAQDQSHGTGVQELSFL